MKSLIIAITVLAIICAGVGTSAYYVHSSCRELTEIAESLPGAVYDPNDIRYAQFNDVMEKFHTIWHKKRVIIRNTVGHAETDTVDDALDEITVRFSYGDQVGYMAARRRLISQLEKIGMTEEISFDSLF